MTKITVYTPEIFGAVLSDHSEIVGIWLNKLHEKYLTQKKSCEFDRNPVACFNMLPLQQFEKHFQIWQDGGIITISIQQAGKVIRVRNEKSELKTQTTLHERNKPTCSTCSATFSDSEEYGRHRLREIDASRKREGELDRAEVEFVREKDIPLNPIWWLSYS
jgi:hypothetical protein